MRHVASLSGVKHFKDHLEDPEKKMDDISTFFKVIFDTGCHKFSRLAL